jgi:hypothetical protein
MPSDQVIVQFKIHPGTSRERLWHIEDTLIQGFSQSDDGYVDGNDIGSGTFNIFIVKKGSWKSVLERTVAFLELRDAMPDAVIVKAHGKKRRFEVVHPPGIRDFAL